MNILRNLTLPNGTVADIAIESGRIHTITPSAEPASGLHVLPGFIDAHCHILPTGLDLLKCSLLGCESRAELLERLIAWDRENPSTNWLHAVQYDQNRFSDGQHLTLHDLDPHFPHRPVLLRHSNGHASVANTAALVAAGVSPNEPDPEGGSFGRDASGNLDGTLFELAHERVTSASPDPNLEEMVEAILRCGQHLAKMGITCASDMMTGRWHLLRELEAYRIAAERGCAIRTRLYLQWKTVLGPRAFDRSEINAQIAAMDDSRVAVRGLKIFADGAIGSATAATYRPYPNGGTGQLIYSEDKLKEMVRLGDDAGFSIAIHTIGDRSTDLVMDAFAATPDPARHRIEHAMILSEAQRDRIADLGAHVTMQPEFLMRFGHAYQAQLGPEISLGLKPVASLLRRGTRLSFNSDRPIVAGHPWDGIAAAVNRPAGFDPAENVTEDTAIALWTSGGADANQDPGQGTLNPGAWADLALYSGAPSKGTLKSVFRAGESTVEL